MCLGNFRIQTRGQTFHTFHVRTHTQKIFVTPLILECRKFDTPTPLFVKSYLKDFISFLFLPLFKSLRQANKCKYMDEGSCNSILENILTYPIVNNKYFTPNFHLKKLIVEKGVKKELLS